MRTHLLVLVAVVACAAPKRDAVEAPSALTTLAVLHGLTSDEGVAPRDGMALGPDGMLWGTSWVRGPNRVDPPTGSCSSTGTWSTDYQTKLCPGTVWRASTAGALEVVHAFTTLDDHYRNVDGYQPTAAPVYGGDGWMYGTTSKGGSPMLSPTAGGVGVIYRINVVTLEFQIVHTFCVAAGCRDGMYPYGGLRGDGRGHLVLAAKGGGPGSAGGVVVVDLETQAVTMVRGFAPVTLVRDASGKLVDQYNTDGGNPFGPPVVGWDGAMHISPPSWGPQGDHGTLLTIGFDGNERIDAAFPAVVSPINSDNASMASQIVSGRDGHILGIRQLGGANGTGEVYELAADGAGYRSLFSFDTTSVNTPTGHYSAASGANPQGTLLEDLDGSLIGTTFFGGPTGRGTIFRLGRDGVLTTLYAFTNVAGSPQFPSSGLTRGPDGALYGVTQGDGSIYQLTE